MQDTQNQAIVSKDHHATYTGQSLATQLGLDWRSLYKYLNSKGYNYLAEDNIPSLVVEEVVQKYAPSHHRRPIAVSNAARTLASQLNIELDNYEHLTEEAPAGEAPSPADNKPSDKRKPNRNRKPKRKDTIQLEGLTPQSNVEKVERISFYQILLYLAAIVFISFDGFSAAFIVLSTYTDIGETTEALLNAIQSIKTNPILMYGTIVGALAGVFIGFIAIGSIVNFKGEKDQKNILKGAFALYQFVLHFMAMPQKNAAMIVFSLGLTIGTLGCTIAIDNKLNNKTE